MANANNKFLPGCAPIWGFPMHMKISDFSSRYADPAKVITGAVADTTSAAISLGWRGLKLSVSCADPTCTVSIDLIQVGTPDKVVKTWTAAPNNAVLWAGNLEMIDLGGAPIKIRVYNITASSVSVTAVPTY